MASERKGVLLVEDHPLVLEILSLVAKATFHSPVIHTATSIQRALEIVRRESKLDLVVLDLLLPDSGRYEGLRELVAACGGIPILVFSAIEEPKVIQEVLDAGAAGYAPKTTPRPVLSNVMRLVAAGGRYVPPQALGQKALSAPRAKENRLTPRQVEVLYLVSQGLSNKEIAKKMGITVETVKQHLQAIYTVLGATSRMRAVVIARRLGIKLEDASGSSGK